MNNLTSNKPLFIAVPGATASGIANGRQLVERTTATGLVFNMTAAPRPLVIQVPLQEAPVDVALALEKAADELDRDIARKRLAEINENPALLIKGEQLHERLAMIKP
jgi:hypothetical protein